MFEIHTLVSEAAVDLVNFAESADKKSFEVALRRNSHVKRNVERVVMSDERFRRGTADERVHHRSFDFHETCVVHVVSDEIDDFHSLFESFADIVVHDEVEVSLAVAELFVGKSVEFFGKRSDIFGEKLCSVR